MGPDKNPNRLIKEKSPYLLQHAFNPVDWFPWGEEAFRTAAEENKPVFLSIGYSTCHWCHVMEKESFEDGEVARLMNRYFVSVKVDREERPDIDNTYMHVCQMMTGRGGWPLTILMTPDKRPFFAGTYLPRTQKYNQIGLLELIPRVAELWQNRKEDLVRSARSIVQALASPAKEPSRAELQGDVLDSAYKQLEENFDSGNGGFGQAPKFPTPQNILFLLRYWKRTGQPRALEMAERTLRALRNGGICDHIGFGFHRYATDSRWIVPHFEKMLYDQAMLTVAFAEAFQATQRMDFRTSAEEIISYVQRDMASPEGAFYSAEDADSEGEEGKFYTWSWEEIRSLLDSEELELVKVVFNVRQDGNYKEESTGEQTGRNILYSSQNLQTSAEILKTEPEALKKNLEGVRKKLFSERERRVRPLRDDKILTDWNGLFIGALAKAARAFNEPQYSQAAEKAVVFFLEKMWNPDRGLLHRFRDGEAAVPAFADDYAFLIWGLTELYQATFKSGYLQKALELNAYFLSHFWDPEDGGFFFTSDEGEELLLRKKEIFDGALPSSNSVAFLNLSRLARIMADPGLDKKSTVQGQQFGQTILGFPSAYTFFLLSLDYALGPSSEVVVVGSTDSPDTQTMLTALQTEFLPNTTLIHIPTGRDGTLIRSLAPFTADFSSLNNRATAYVCRNQMCRKPTTDPALMLEYLLEK